MSNPWEKIGDKGIVPVIKIEKAEYAEPLAKALMAGGIPILEVTLRSDAALEAIHIIKTRFPEMSVSAGTVLSVEQAKEAAAAGAELIVTPGFQRKTVAYCVENGIPILPGCVTASEVTEAMEFGLDTLKFFPAEQCGGINAIEQLGGPFGNVKFIPTGGINFDTMQRYLASPRILAVGGSFMAKAEWIRAGNWEQITASCKRAMDISIGFSLAHVGINWRDEAEARAGCEAFCRILRQPVEEKTKSCFAGSFIENMKYPFYGTNGHIGFKVNSLRRALAFFAEQGIAIDESSRQFDKNGKLSCVYLKDEIGGFAVHIV